MSAPRPSGLYHYAAPEELEVGGVRWPGDTHLTIIVKATFVRGGGGQLERKAPGDSLSLDQVDRDGVLVYPSDFAPFKPRCDVVLAGGDAKTRSKIASFTIGSTVLQARDGARLGARELFARAGDPTEPSALKAWSSGQIDFARFQCAPPDQRMDPPTIPLSIAVEREAERIVVEIPGPGPEAVVLDENGWSAPERVALVLDTLCLSPSADKWIVVWRGVSQLGEHLPEAPLLAVAMGSLRQYSTRAILEWERRRLVRPEDLRAPVTSAAAPPPPSMSDVSTVSERSPAEISDELTFADQTMSMVGAPASKPLPFEPDRAAGPPSKISPPRSDDFAESGGTRLVDNPSVGQALPFRAPDSIPRAAERERFEESTPKTIAAPSAPTLPFAAPAPAPNVLERGRAKADHPRILTRADIAPASPWQAHTALVGHPSIGGAPPPPPAPERVAAQSRAPAGAGSWGVPSYMAAGAELAPQVGFARPEDAAAPLPVPDESIEPEPPSTPDIETAPDASAEPDPAEPVNLSIEECARTGASIARRPADKATILETFKLDDLRWREIDHHWAEEILHTAGQGQMDLLERYDDAYVGRIEEERGLLEPSEYARVVVAAERGTSSAVLAELTIPKDALFRIERVWLKKMAKDAAFGKIVSDAVKSAREAKKPDVGS